MSDFIENHTIIFTIVAGVVALERNEGFAAVVTLKVFHIFQQERAGLVVIDDLRCVEKKCSLRLVKEAVLPAKCVFLRDPRNGKRLTRKPGQ